MDSNNLTIIQVDENDKDIIRNLLPLFIHDISEYDSDEHVNERGAFDLDFLEMYWKEYDLIPLLVKVQENIAGFILLQTGKYAPPSKEDYYIGQFFILKHTGGRGLEKKLLGNC